ncbi:sulfotransferase [Acidocella sp.]|uniref:sulfotransferase family protein n=1 Tax=Acidocella sp. TaxID=50710 RepID=UPI00261EBF62|nr:sulfotransferase [Acidocella sp.]
MRAMNIVAAGFRAADSCVPRFLLPSCSPDALIKAAKARPDPQAREGLNQLLASIEAESDLALFGRLALRWDMQRLLENAQLVADAHAANPELARRPVEAPIFILGLPRSGTSYLHTLLAADRDNLIPRNWQTMFPAPRPKDFDPAKSRSARMVDRQFALFSGLAPGFDDMHPTTADSPQECSEITAHVFQSLRFDTTHRVPGYFGWLEAHGHDGALAYHKQFLQFLQQGLTGRWVLKCPDHTFTLDAILRAYPDARFVIVHRDPIAVLGSVAHLTAVLRKPFLRGIDPAEIGAQVAERWMHGANLLLEFDRRADVAAERKCHVHYEELVNAPMPTIARIYRQFGVTMEEGAEAAMSGLVVARPQGGYAKHAPYRLDAFKLNLPALQAAFAPYVRTYCRAPE